MTVHLDYARTRGRRAEDRRLGESRRRGKPRPYDGSLQTQIPHSVRGHFQVAACRN